MGEEGTSPQYLGIEPSVRFSRRFVIRLLEAHRAGGADYTTVVYNITSVSNAPTRVCYIAGRYVRRAVDE